MKEDLLKIINRYGVNAQQRKLAEEIFELQEQITQYEHYLSCFSSRMLSTEEIAEELADVMVLLNQFKLNYGISDEELSERMQFKIDRQLERIEAVDDRKCIYLNDKPNLKPCDLNTRNDYYIIGNYDYLFEIRGDYADKFDKESD